MAAGPSAAPATAVADTAMRLLRWRSRTQAFVERVD